MYEEKSVTINNILSKVWSHSSLFADKKSPASFNKWCSTRNIKFLEQQSKRKKNDMDERVSVRSLYVMMDKHITINDIADCLPKYQEYIQQLKDQGYTMVGYCRKSKQTREDSNDRQRLLQKQVERLKARSLVDKVFVSVYCKSSDPIANRDLKSSSHILNGLTGVDGDMQDLLKVISTTQKVCLVTTLDTAGLTTSKDDLLSFLRVEASGEANDEASVEPSYEANDEASVAANDEASVEVSVEASVAPSYKANDEASVDTNC
ncbi:formin-binding protein [Mucor velutinosus]|uniref:Formin-binding protein n=1 Tax=Mucor velutinosus TaxID=708070 RepID=A0AAN7HVL4_9FUNG|nr:formin-binding protein [Mucor velutinosus]